MNTPADKAKFTVRQVDGTGEKNFALLRWLQLEILPADEPLSSASGFWWLVCKQEQPVGFAGLTRSSQWTDAGYLCRSGLLIPARGQGLQKRLLRVREVRARALGWNWLITDTLHNPASANSLIGCGFKMFEPTNPWGIATTCYWRKDLRKGKPS